MSSFSHFREKLPFKKAYAVSVLLPDKWYHFEFDDLDVAQGFARCLSSRYKVRAYCRTVQLISFDF